MLEISVCMATFNGAPYIEAQLQSILEQLPGNAEVVIADDGSTDATLEKVSAMGDARIKVLSPAQPTTQGGTAAPLGPTYNLERALAAAQGKYIFIADQDDVWLPGKVSRVLEALERHTLVMHDAFMLVPTEGDSEPDTPSKLSSFHRDGLLSDVRPFGRGLFRNWLKNGYHGCCLAFRRELLTRALPFPKNLPMHDQWLGLIAEKYFDAVYLPDVLVEYRQHKKNATRITGGPAGILQKIKWRLDLLKALMRPSHIPHYTSHID